jgi:aldose 1-epimerase
LHGGWRGFDKYVWHMEPFTRGGADGLRLSRTSPAAEEHYPGALTATVEYEVSDTGEWRITYDAVSDAPTIVNLTQHTYFNLSGAAIVIDDHVLTMHASHYLPVDAGLIPTGEIRAVSGTPFDFTTGRRIGDALRANAEQLTRAGGFDHNFVLDAEAGVDGASIAARVEEPRSGRVLEVLTRQPGIQFYSGNLLDGTIQGRHGFYGHRTGFCLETQKFPDTPNHPAFGTAVLRPGERYESSTVYRFSTS